MFVGLYAAANARTGAQLDFLPIDGEGRLVLDDLDTLLTERTKLVAITHQSNVLGTINPVREIAARVHDAGALILVDGAQSVPHMPVNVQALGIDFLAFSGHKMCGPTGIGALLGRRLQARRGRSPKPAVRPAPIPAGPWRKAFR